MNKTELLATTTIFHEGTAPEVYRVGLTDGELASHENWDDLRDLLVRKGVPLYKLLDNAPFRQLIVKDGVILEFD
jgi:hypothetical protein